MKLKLNYPDKTPHFHSFVLKFILRLFFFFFIELNVYRALIIGDPFSIDNLGSFLMHSLFHSGPSLYTGFPKRNNNKTIIQYKYVLTTVKRTEEKIKKSIYQQYLIPQDFPFR